MNQTELAAEILKYIYNMGPCSSLHVSRNADGSWTVETVDASPNRVVKLVGVGETPLDAWEAV